MVVASKNTALSTFAAELAQEAQNQSAKEVLTTTNISFEGGRVSIAGQQAEGNKLACIIVDSAYENALYDGPYDPNNKRGPICFAVGKEEGELAPHENSSAPQNADCKTCEHNQFGSSGKGKTCKNVRRLVVISADAESTEAVQESEAFLAKIPPTSLKGWALYVKGVTSNMQRPLWSIASEISAVPEKSYFRVVFKPIGPLADEVAMAVREKIAAVQDQLMNPYAKAEEKPVAAKGPQKKMKFAR
jgi:hypothetical protein